MVVTENDSIFATQKPKGWLNRGLFDNHTGMPLPALLEFGKYNIK